MHMAHCVGTIHSHLSQHQQVDEQAIDRAHRIGQKRPVTVYRFVTESSVEERMVQFAEKKLFLSDMVTDIDATQAMMSNIGRAELLSILGTGASSFIGGGKDTTAEDFTAGKIDQVLGGSGNDHNHSYKLDFQALQAVTQYTSSLKTQTTRSLKAQPKVSADTAADEKGTTELVALSWVLIRVTAECGGLTGSRRWKHEEDCWICRQSQCDAKCSFCPKVLSLRAGFSCMLMVRSVRCTMWIVLV